MPVVPEEPSSPDPRRPKAQRPGTVMQGGRAKAYRPLAPAARAEAFAAGLAAYRRGDFFEAHELLEPAWMGTNDLAERDLYQALIKLAAAFVHRERGNGAGVVKNLRGARERLARVPAARGGGHGVDPAALITAIDDDLRALEAGSPLAEVAPPLLGDPFD